MGGDSRPPHRWLTPPFPPRAGPPAQVCSTKPAAIYCHNDAAFLCSDCDLEVHSSNPVPHTTVPAREGPAAPPAQQVGLGVGPCRG
jgi:hypothetical protein